MPAAVDVAFTASEVSATDVEVTASSCRENMLLLTRYLLLRGALQKTLKFRLDEVKYSSEMETPP